MSKATMQSGVPLFELPDENGEGFDLANRLSERPVVLVFYRGDW